MIENIQTLLNDSPNSLVVFLDDVRSYIDAAVNANLERERVLREIQSWVAELNEDGEWDNDITIIPRRNINDGYKYALTDAFSDTKTIGQTILELCGLVLQEVDRQEPYYEGPRDLYIAFSIHRSGDYDLMDMGPEETVQHLARHSLQTFIIHGAYCSHGGSSWDDEMHVANVATKIVLDIEVK